MKPIAINLRHPFEAVVATVLELPPGAGNTAADDKETIKAVRRLYEAAHGRSVETSIGLIPIAPAIASSLVAKPFYVSSRAELLDLVKRPIALTRAYQHQFRQCQLPRPLPLAGTVPSSDDCVVLFAGGQTSPRPATRSGLPFQTNTQLP